MKEIFLLSRLRDESSYGTKGNFEELLSNKMKNEFDKRVEIAEMKNKQLQGTAEDMRLSILGKDTKVKDDKPLDVVDAYVKENTTELVDPIGVEEKISKLQEKIDTLLTELDTQIKVSNATTFVEIHEVG